MCSDDGRHVPTQENKRCSEQLNMCTIQHGELARSQISLLFKVMFSKLLSHLFSPCAVSALMTASHTVLTFDELLDWYWFWVTDSFSFLLLQVSLGYIVCVTSSSLSRARQQYDQHVYNILK